jgi:hypothetical protein
LAQLRHGLRVETEWNPKVGLKAAQGSAKMWRGNADNQVAFPAETYHPANDMLVGPEFPSPKRIRDHNNGGLVLLFYEASAERRLCSDY